MRLFIRSLTLGSLCAGALSAQQLPPIRSISSTASAGDSLGMVAAVRQLPGGRLLVNDPARRRVLLLDSTLATVAVVADSTAATGNAYASMMAGLMPYRADSTLFIDPQSLSMLVLDPSGKVGRVMSVPRSEDAFALAGPFGGASWDGRGGIVYRANNFMRRGPGAPGAPAGAGGPGAGGPMIQTPPDTAAIVRIDLETRKLDTLAWIKVQNPAINISRDEEGRMQVTRTVNPLPIVDEWAVTSDGALAVVRGRDYHVDWVNPDGSKTSSTKVPFEWQRLSDDDKVAFLDSVKAYRARTDSIAAASGRAATEAGTMVMRGGPPPGAAAGGAERVQMTIVMGEGGAPGGQRGGGAPAPMRFSGAPTVTYVDPSSLPDYKPPFFSGAVRADADGNVWVRTIPTKQIPGGPVYDVVNRRGELVDRVQVPANRQVIGFGPGIVYLSGSENGRTILERARIR